MQHWPLEWWWGAMAMAAITVGFWLLTGRPLGVSGCWTRLVTAREDAKLRAVEAQVAANPDAFEAAMLAAALEEFGAAAVQGSPAAPAPAKALAPVTAVRAPWTAHLVFLLAMGLGGALASLTFRGGLTLRLTPGQDFERYFGSGWAAGAVLLGGGLLVGFGTRMCGGCSSGHGLSGISRLQKGSMVSTAAFFASAAVVSLLVARVLR